MVLPLVINGPHFLRVFFPSPYAILPLPLVINGRTTIFWRDQFFQHLFHFLREIYGSAPHMSNHGDNIFRAQIFLLLKGGDGTVVWRGRGGRGCGETAWKLPFSNLLLMRIWNPIRVLRTFSATASAVFRETISFLFFLGCSYCDTVPPTAKISKFDKNKI